MNKNIESYIVPAMHELETSLENGKIQKEYKGYISSLGASINMSGLIPALAFYSSKENSDKGDRSKVLNWVFNILKRQDNYSSVPPSTDIFTYARGTGINKARLEKDIIDVSVALKLCIRTFELTK